LNMIARNPQAASAERAGVVVARARKANKRAAAGPANPYLFP